MQKPTSENLRVSESDLHVALSDLVDVIDESGQATTTSGVIKTQLTRLTDYIEDMTDFGIVRSRTPTISYGLEGANLLLAVYQYAVKEAQNGRLELKKAAETLRDSPARFLTQAGWMSSEPMLAKARGTPYLLGILPTRLASFLMLILRRVLKKHLERLNCELGGVILGPLRNPEWLQQVKGSSGSNFDLDGCLLIQEWPKHEVPFHEDKGGDTISSGTRTEFQTEVLYRQGAWKFSMEANRYLLVLGDLGSERLDLAAPICIFAVRKEAETDAPEMASYPEREIQALDLLEVAQLAASESGASADVELRRLEYLLSHISSALVSIRDHLPRQPLRWHYFSNSISFRRAKLDLETFVEECVKPLLPADIHVFVTQDLWKSGPHIRVVDIGSEYGYDQESLFPAHCRWVTDNKMTWSSSDVSMHEETYGQLSAGLAISFPLIVYDVFSGLLNFARRGKTEPLGEMEVFYLSFLAEVLASYLARKDLFHREYQALKLVCEDQPYLNYARTLYTIQETGRSPERVTEIMLEDRIKSSIAVRDQYAGDEIGIAVVEVCASKMLAEGTPYKDRLVGIVVQQTLGIVQDAVRELRSEDPRQEVKVLDPVANDIFLLSMGVDEDLLVAALDSVKDKAESAYRPRGLKVSFKVSYRHKMIPMEKAERYIDSLYVLIQNEVRRLLNGVAKDCTDCDKPEIVVESDKHILQAWP